MKEYMENLVNEDLLKNIFHLEDFTQNEQMDNYDISYIKKGDLLTISVKNHNYAEDLKDYISTLEDDIYLDFCDQYEDYTGESLKDLNDRIDDNDVDTSDIDTVKTIVKSIVISDINEKLTKYDILKEFTDLLK